MFDLFTISDIITMQFSFYIVLALNVIIGTYYVLGKRTSNLKYIIFGNIAYLLIFLVVIIDIHNTNFRLPIIVALFDVLAITFWIMGYNKSLDIPQRIKTYFYLNLSNVVFVGILYSVTEKISIARSVSSLIIVVLVSILLIDIFSKKSMKKLASFHLLTFSLIVYSVFKIVVVGYRAYSMSYEQSIESIVVSINIFTMINLVFAIWINFTHTLLNYDVLHNELKNLSFRDFLTKLPNRRNVMSKLNELLAFNKRGKLNFGVVLFDIDDFKHVNDKYGHDVGDQVLIEFSNVLTRSVRDIDFVSRYGGEEFLVLLQLDDCESAHKFINRITNNINKSNFTEHNINISVSGGLVIVSDEYVNQDVDVIIRKADKRLYEAKAKGKNQVISECKETQI
ncbi:hypothetical protein CI105_09000 [Candidatus Izimaplasma bacterium ZiA1]|uniref:GGDEF domain-containing protein n=1 Tax=Candidatus Izimoplasma sp. ZiA1 TaxID=2024899 RepID=UPI000BAA80DC|nr:hypothetical protein CI105_09000 [Candidatus Izimaplasma bacterium ZiA1]